MGITVKKKKLTVKTINAQKSDTPAADGPEAKPGASEIPAPESTAPESGIPTVAPPVAAAAAPATKSASYTLAGALAIVAVIMFVALIVLQSLEWNFFNDAFPRPAPPGTSSAPISRTVPESLTPQPLDALDE